MKLLYSLPLALVLHIILLAPWGNTNMPGHLTQTQSSNLYVYHMVVEHMEFNEIMN